MGLMIRFIAFWCNRREKNTQRKNSPYNKTEKPINTADWGWQTWKTLNKLINGG